MSEKQKIRCAIYTRKSSEEGLEQNFNSLHAQREACEAYVRSQKAEGWKLLPGTYDDGGHSGGTLGRPALTELLTDIEAGRIDMVVVYKIDRLTRSLSDFARLIDRLDAAGATFVSVTQSFNTSTSMGRLTLNVLLSFAQFEREVTAERIRDKIAASKKKGMWMGGMVPLGYEAKDRSLVINEEEAETVRAIFALYLELGCLRKVKAEADRRGIVSKHRKFESGKTYGGVPLSRGRIHHLLTNPVYIGEIRHKEKSYPGNHEAIIDLATWNHAQEMLCAAATRKRKQSGARHPSPLAGKIFDETGDRLTPSHAGSGTRRHRYYVSRRLIERSGENVGDGWRLPAGNVENTVARCLADTMLPAICKGLQAAAEQASKIETYAARLAAAQEQLRGSKGLPLGDLVRRIDIAEGEMTILLADAGIAKAFGTSPECLQGELLIRKVSFDLRRRGVEARMILGDFEAEPDRVMIKAIARSVIWLEQIRDGETLETLATGTGVSKSYIRKMLKLAYLSPAIVEDIVCGRQPTEITLAKLIGCDLPLSWDEQAQKLGFAHR